MRQRATAPLFYATLRLQPIARRTRSGGRDATRDSPVGIDTVETIAPNGIQVALPPAANSLEDIIHRMDIRCGGSSICGRGSDLVEALQP